MGIAKLQRRDVLQAGILPNWLESSVLTATLGQILPVTETIARTAARLHVPDPKPFSDTLIAATAVIHA